MRYKSFVWPRPGSLWPRVFSQCQHRQKLSRGLASRWFKTTNTQSLLLYLNGRVFVCSYVMWVNVSGSQSGGLHPASDGPHCSWKTPLCVIETCSSSPLWSVIRLLCLLTPIIRGALRCLHVAGGTGWFTHGCKFMSASRSQTGRKKQTNAHFNYIFFLLKVPNLWFSLF